MLTTTNQLSINISNEVTEWIKCKTREIAYVCVLVKTTVLFEKDFACALHFLAEDFLAKKNNWKINTSLELLYQKKMPASRLDLLHFKFEFVFEMGWKADVHYT